MDHTGLELFSSWSLRSQTGLAQLNKWSRAEQVVCVSPSFSRPSVCCQIRRIRGPSDHPNIRGPVELGHGGNEHVTWALNTTLLYRNLSCPVDQG